MLTKKFSTNLLTFAEQQRLYAIPSWSAKQRTEYFTFTPDERKLVRHASPASEIYCMIILVLFKFRHSIIKIKSDDVKKNIKHLQCRYFPDAKGQKIVLPTDSKTITRIENKVLTFFNYQRCRGDALNHLKKRMARVANRYPKQRALCKATLDVCTHERIVKPSLTTLQEIVQKTWSAEKQRIQQAYRRHTVKAERNTILSLLDKSDTAYPIMILRQEMKSFSTSDIRQAVEQQELLVDIFIIAKKTIPKLKIPNSTVEYYAGLVDYYKGSRLATLEGDAVQIYLLCYCFIRFQKLNDSSIEAFRKRALDYETKIKKNTQAKSAEFLAKTRLARKQVSDMLRSIKRSTHKTHIPKATLFKHVPENQLEETAQLLLDDSLDPDLLFWQAIDKQATSIAYNLRPLFLSLDLVIVNHDALEAAVKYLKTYLQSQSKSSIPLPNIVRAWLSPKVKEFIIVEDTIEMGRLEFWIYYQLAKQVKNNKLTLQHSFKYKALPNDLKPKKTWRKEKSKILQSIPHERVSGKPQTLYEEAKAVNHRLLQEVNHAIANGENPDIIISKNQDGDTQWRLKPLKERQEPLESFFANFPRLSIVHVMRIIDQLVNFSALFDSIAPKGASHDRDPLYIMASILANALRVGTKTMGEISDLNPNSLDSVEQSCIRMETLSAAIQLLYDRANQLPIFNAWNIQGYAHAHLDGLRLGVQLDHSKARASAKYPGLGENVSSYNLILNHFPITGTIIGANEYEGHFAFELSQFQNTSGNLLDRVSTDKHGMNSINFLLFHLTDMIFAPRIPKMHKEALWGFDRQFKSDNNVIYPKHVINEKRFYDEWDNIQHFVASILTGDVNASTIISKFASPGYRSQTKLAMVDMNQVLKSNFILQCIQDNNFRHAIEQALNRGEAFNRLYRSITLLNKGELRGTSELEMMIWDACTRLLAAIILYYNSYILNHLYERAASQQEKEYLLRIVPMAWTHINLLGHYQFFDNMNPNLSAILKSWRWQEQVEFG